MGSLGLTVRNKKFYQGFYQPKNINKYIGKKDNIIYRSGLELKFYRFCDNNPNVIEWGSEEIIIPYFDSVQKKNRKYFIDAYVKIKEGDVIKISDNQQNSIIYLLNINSHLPHVLLLNNSSANFKSKFTFE